MKSLKESIFDDVEDIANNDTILIEKFLNDNYEIEGSYAIKDGVVDVNGDIIVKNKNIESFTKGLFRFRSVTGGFSCSSCLNIKSLNGVPEEIGKWFNCYKCDELTSLEGAPKKVGGNFECSLCHKLKSLEGAPKKVGMGFYCIQCKNLASLKGAPREVGKSFWCDNCPKLKSLEGAPDKVGAGIYCRECDSIKITDRDRKKYNINP